jgi:predicted transcriptional regulator
MRRPYERSWKRDEHGGKKQSVAVLEVIQEGPSTAPEVAAELDITTKTATAVLRALHEKGVVSRKLMDKLDSEPGRRAYLYSIAEAAA